MKTIQSEFEKHGIKNRQRKKQKRKINEKFSERDLRDLMGVNRPTYGRRNGAIRQK